jgi:hypothetical protein
VSPDSPIILLGHSCRRGTAEPARNLGNAQLCIIPIAVFIAVLLGRLMVIVGSVTVVVEL